MKHSDKNRYILSAVALVAAVVAFFVEPTGWLGTMVAAFVLSYTMMCWAIPNILVVCYRRGLYDQPGGRHIHTTPIPKLGGWSFAPIVCSTVILTLALHRLLAPEFHTGMPDCMMWICALVFIHATGTVDDLVGVRHWVKIAIQAIAAVLVVASGFWIGDLHGLAGIHTLSPWVGMPMTVLFIVGMINAISVLDGIDGLASGLCIIILSVWGGMFYAAGQWLFAIVAFSGVGVLVPFFCVNMWGSGRPHRRLFMGDGGSQAMGLIVSVLAVVQMSSVGTVFADTSFAVALSPLVVPIFDVVHVVGCRLRRRLPLLGPDLWHIHYRMMNKGLNQRQTLAAILCLVVGVILLDAALAPHMNVTWILLVDAVVWVVFNSGVVAVNVKGARRRAMPQKDKQL